MALRVRAPKEWILPVPKEMRTASPVSRKFARQCAGRAKGCESLYLLPHKGRAGRRTVEALENRTAASCVVATNAAAFFSLVKTRA